MQKNKINDLSYDEIKKGDSFSFTKKINHNIIRAFAELTGDHSPLHMDRKYARDTAFGGRIAHGMLLGSFFSTLVGMLCPGRRALYLSQDLQFRQPLKLGTTVIILGEVTRMFGVGKIIEITTRVQDKKDGTVYVDGHARVQVRER